ncbi:MAG TPA: hypothetical protein VMV18_09755 [bacterium]|nr:hypothetical protein [bacterium]
MADAAAGLDIETLAKGLRAQAPGAPFLVGRGEMPVGGERWRCGVLAIPENARPWLVWDGPLLQSEREALTRTLGAWPGQLDFMAATPWKYAWTVPPAPFRLWREKGLRCAVDGDVIRVRRVVGMEQVARVADARAVEVELSADWTLRRVLLHLAGREPLLIAKQADAFPTIDPTYDGINLMFDASWALDVARSLAAALKVETRIPDALR